VSGPGQPSVDPAAIALLEQAALYALGTAGGVTPELMSRPTPCREWDLRMLLLHTAESMAALTEGLDGGRVGLRPARAKAPADAGRALRQRANDVLASCSRLGGHASFVAIGDRSLQAGLFVSACALEIAVHGWDVSQATGQREPVPADLARHLLRIAPVLVSHDRESLFARPVRVDPAASPSDQLIAFLGRAVPARG